MECKSVLESAGECKNLIQHRLDIHRHQIAFRERERVYYLTHCYKATGYYLCKGMTRDNYYCKRIYLPCTKASKENQ
jgi:hypothetical protein